MEVKVDTFTTAKFGHSVSTYSLDINTFSFFDEAHTYFIPKILKGIKDYIKDNPPPPPNKKVLRDIITSSLCDTRDIVRVFVPGNCRFKCHKVDDPLSKTMADMFIMAPGSSMVETVFSVDLTTGTKEDVHDKFGFELVTNPIVTRPIRNKIPRLERMAIKLEKNELHNLKGRIDREEEYRRRSERLAQARRFLKGEVKSANYRYAPDYAHNYVTVTDDKGNSYQMIKLSDVIQIAIDNGTIKPKIDFVIVQACRTFDGQLPPGIPTSPGRPNPPVPGHESSGGRKRMSRTLLTKNRNNRNKNKKNKNKHKTTKKRKRKTIRRLCNF
jgi:hypothetical protein